MGKKCIGPGRKARARCVPLVPLSWTVRGQNRKTAPPDCGKLSGNKACVTCAWHLLSSRTRIGVLFDALDWPVVDSRHCTIDKFCNRWSDRMTRRGPLRKARGKSYGVRVALAAIGGIFGISDWRTDLAREEICAFMAASPSEFCGSGADDCVAGIISDCSSLMGMI